MHYKQVILIRRDLKMRRGKEIAQGSHASMMFLASRLRQPADGGALVLSELEKVWLGQGMAKVCVKVHSEEELLDYHQKAKQAGVASYLVRDSGKTEFGGTPTYTACAVGPDTIERVDAITAELTLY